MSEFLIGFVDLVKKSFKYTVLLSFCLNVLMPSYAFAVGLAAHSDAYSEAHHSQLRTFKTGVLLRTFPSPLFSFQDFKKSYSDPTALSRSPSISSLEDLETSSSFLSQGEDQPPLTEPQSEDEYGLSEAESDVSEVISLDDLMEDPTYTVDGQAGTVVYAGYLFICNTSGQVTIRQAHSHASSVLHVLNPYGAVLLDQAMDLENLYVEALGCEVHANVSAEVSVFNLMQADGKSSGSLMLAKQASLLTSQLTLNHVNASLLGELVFKDEAVMTLGNSQVMQQQNVIGQGALTIEGQRSSWHVSDKDLVLAAKGDMKAAGVSLTNAGAVQAEGILDWQGEKLENTATLSGKKGVILKAEGGRNAGKIASSDGDIAINASIQTHASSVIESNKNVVLQGHALKDVTLEGTIKANILNVEGKNLTNKATVQVREARLLCGGTLDQQKKLHADTLNFTGNRIVNQGDTSIGVISASQRMEIVQTGKLSIDRGSLFIGQLRDVAGTTTLLPTVTLGQKDQHICGHVDIKQLKHGPYASKGKWRIDGKLIVRDGQLDVDQCVVEGELGLSGQGSESVIEGVLSGIPSTPRDLNRTEKKAILRQIYERNRYAIEACGEAGMHSYYHMLAWMHETQFFEKKLGHGWILEEMVQNAGPWEWATDRYASPSEVAWLRHTESKRGGLASMRVEAMRARMKNVYQSNLHAIHYAADMAAHPYFRMLKWLDDTHYFAHNIHEAWMRPLVIEYAAHWGWRYDGRSAEEQRLYDVFIGNAGQSEAIRHRQLQHWHYKNPQGPTKHSHLRGLWDWMNQFARSGSWGYAASIEDLLIPYRTLNSALDLPIEEGVTAHAVNDLCIGKKGKLSMLAGGRLKPQSVQNLGRIRALQSPLKLINTASLSLGAIEMGNDELIVEITDNADLATYIEKEAPKWLVHKLRLKAPKLQLTRDWHWTYRKSDGSNAPFMWGSGVEIESVWNTWKAQKDDKKIACDVIIDVVEFINQAILNVTGRVEIISHQDLDNRDGRIRGTHVIARSTEGKVLVGRPTMAGFYHYPNGAFMMSDQDMTLHGHGGIEIDFGVLTCLGNGHFVSPAMLNFRGANVYIKGHTRYEVRDLNVKVTDVYRQQYSSAMATGYTDNDIHWAGGWREHSTCNGTLVQMGSQVDLILGASNIGSLYIYGNSEFIAFGKVTNRFARELTTLYPGQNVIITPFVRKHWACHRQGWWHPEVPVGTDAGTFQTSSVLDLTKVHYFSMNGGVLVAGSASIEALVFHINGSNLAVRSYNVADATPFLSAIHRAPPGVVRYNEDITRPLFSMNTYAAHKPLPLMPLVVPPAVYNMLYPLLANHLNVDKWATDEKLMARDLIAFMPRDIQLRYSMDLETLMMLLPTVLLNQTGMAFCFANMSLQEHQKLLVQQGWALTHKPGRKRVPILSTEDVAGAPSFMALRLCDATVFQPSQGVLPTLTEEAWKEAMSGRASTAGRAVGPGFRWQGVLDPFIHTAPQDSSIRQALRDAGCAMIAVDKDISLTGVVVDEGADGVRSEAHAGPAVDVRPEAFIKRAHMVAPQGDVRMDYAGGSLTFQAVNVEANNIDLQADAVRVIEDHDLFTSYTSEGKSQTTHIEKRSVGSRLSARGQVFLRSLKEALTLQHITMKAEKATLFSGCGMIRWLLGTNMSQTITTTKSSNFLWSKMRQDYQEHHTYSRNDTSGVKTFVIETPADRATTIMVQEVEGYTSQLIHQLKDLPGNRLLSKLDN